MKKITTFLIILLVLCLFVESVPLFAEGFHPAQVRDISDRKYEQAVIELIDNAKESVIVGMYHISTQLKTNNPVKLLLNDLVEAQERGAQVKVYLNTKFPDVSYEELIGKDEFKTLKEAGCEVYFIPPGRKLHDKVVIVDSRYVVEASMNWSIVALRNNFESATLIDSPGLAKEKIARLDKIYRMQRKKEEGGEKERRPLYVDSIIDKIEIKEALLEDERYFPGMLKKSDRRAMDLYLILTAYSQKLVETEFFLNLEDTGLGLGLPVSWDDESLRRQVIRTLRTLQNRYNLIEVEFDYASDAYIAMMPVEGQIFTGETKIFSSHDKEIPQRLKFLLMIKALLEKEGKDLDSVPRKEIMERFHISERTLEKVLAELKDK